MNITYKGGFGPWYVSLFKNTNEKLKQKKRLYIHTYPHYVEFVLNNDSLLNKHTANWNGWVLKAQVGKFNNYIYANKFYHCWKENISLKYGIRLAEKYKLNVWKNVQPVKSIQRERKLIYKKYNIFVETPDILDIGYIEEMVNLRKK